MFCCDKCRMQQGWPCRSKTGDNYFTGKFSFCQVCSQERLCYVLPLDELQSLPKYPSCGVKGCEEPALNGRLLCNSHAYPAEQLKSGRRQAIEAQKAKKAKVLEESAEE